MVESCIFCKIVAGDIPSATIYEDADFRVILDISPAAKGHAILIVKSHAANLFETEDTVLAKALPIAKKVAAAIKETLHCDGINLLQNNGTCAGQSVFHLHIHIIPRFEKDELNIPWKAGTYAEGEAAALAEQIRNCMK